MKRTAGLDIRENVLLSDYTTIGLGGPARYFLDCASEEELAAALQFARAENWPVLVLGGGSNLLIPDRGWQGLVIRVVLKGIDFGPAGQVTVAAGEDWDEFVQACIERGLGGLECLSGIPGFVGGTPIQNVGAYGQEVAERIVRVRAVERESGTSVEFDAAECEFAYRMSRFKGREAGRYVVSAVAYSLEPDGSPDIRYDELRRHLANTGFENLAAGGERLQAVRQAVLALRRKKSMVFDPEDPNSRSLGSFFMNPVLSDRDFGIFLERLSAGGIAEDPPRFETAGGIKVPAAWLIERAGFSKGYSLGGAGISEKHALALVNRGGTTADILELAGRIQTSVRERFGVSLHREPVLAE